MVDEFLKQKHVSSDSVEFSAWDLPGITYADGTTYQSKKLLKAITEEQKEHQRKLKQLHEEGYAQGFEKGKLEGQKKGSEELLAQADALSKLSQGLIESLDGLNEFYQQQIKALSFHVAHSLVQYELTHSDKLISKLIEEAVNHLPTKQEDFDILMNPDDKQVVEETVKDKLNGLLEKATLVADESLARGSLHIRSKKGKIDVSIEENFLAILNNVNAMEDE